MLQNISNHHNLWNLLGLGKICMEHGARLNLFPRSWRSKWETMAVNSHLGVHRVLRVVFQVLTWLYQGYEVLKPQIFFMWCMMNSRSIWSSPRALGWTDGSGWGSSLSSGSFKSSFEIQIIFEKSLPFMSRIPQPLSLDLKPLNLGLRFQNWGVLLECDLLTSSANLIGLLC